MKEFDLVAIGGGEAGISAALRGTELGARVCLINAGPELGGGCVQTGTLPSKTLSNAARFLEDLKKGKRYGIPVEEHVKAGLKEINASRHKTTMCEMGILASLIRKQAIETETGEAFLQDRETVAIRMEGGRILELKARRIVIATGSRPVPLAGMPFNGTTLLSSDDVASLEAVPARLLLVGAGVNGCEYAFIFRALGAEVVLVEKLGRALAAQDADVSTVIDRELKKRGIKFLPGTGLERVEEAPGRWVRAHLSSGEPVEADKIIVTVGRRPLTEGLNLEGVGVRTGSRGEILVDERMMTTAPGIYAAGDVLARMMLSSSAVMEARVAAENALGHDAVMDYRFIPWGIYTEPEVGSVGLTAERAAKEGLSVIVGTCGYNDLVRSCLDGSVTGFFKLLFEAGSHRLIGAHIVGQDAAEIIHIAAVAMRMGARAEDLRDQVFNHPTVSEGFAKAASAALKS